MIKRWIVLLLVLCCLPVGALATDYCECPDADTHKKRQEAMESELRAYKAVGAAIAVIKDGRIIDTFYYGKANRADDIPVGPETHFRIASVSKMVSAVGILQLVEQGILELDRDISDYYGYTIRNPRYKDTPITLRQIMSHTATLKDGYHYEKATMGEITPLKIALTGNYVRENFDGYEPGTHVSYSNFGGGLLGSLIEGVTPYQIDEYMTNNVFTPLDITAGYHIPCLPEGSQFARIYSTGSYGVTLDPTANMDCHYDPDMELAYVHSAGGLNITATGLAKILIALAGDGESYGVRILKPETVAMMRTMQDHIGSVQCNADRGLNLNIITNRLVNGRTLYGHQGKAYGMICAAYFDPNDQTGVVLLTNGCEVATVDSVARIARAVIARAYKFFE